MIDIQNSKMHAAVVLALAAAVVVTKEVSVAGRECEADHQCDNGYCYSDTGVCTACTDCQIYLRNPPQWKSCARGHQDCEGCLDGFEVEVLADGSTRDYCVSKKTLGNEQKHVERSTYFWLLIGVPLSVIVIAGIVAFTFYRGVKSRGSCSSVPDLEEPPPPPPPGDDHYNPPPSYDSSVPLLEGVPLVNSVTFVEKEGNSLQQAVPFTDPYPPYRTGTAVGGEAPDDEDNASMNVSFQDHLHDVDIYDPPTPNSQDSNDEMGTRSISPPYLEDENTLPSNWTPGDCNAAISSSPIAEEEQQPALAPSTCSSSTSSLSNPEVLVDETNGRVLNDSGVSTSCSRQSGLSCIGCNDCTRSLETIPVQRSAVDSMRVILNHHRSEEDISTLAHTRANKRQRCDSGSASAQSLQPF